VRKDGARTLPRDCIFLSGAKLRSQEGEKKGEEKEESRLYPPPEKPGREITLPQGKNDSTTAWPRERDGGQKFRTLSTEPIQGITRNERQNKKVGEEILQRRSGRTNLQQENYLVIVSPASKILGEGAKYCLQCSNKKKKTRRGGNRREGKYRRQDTRGSRKTARLGESTSSGKKRRRKKERVVWEMRQTGKNDFVDRRSIISEKYEKDEYDAESWTGPPKHLSSLTPRKKKDREGQNHQQTGDRIARKGRENNIRLKIVKDIPLMERKQEGAVRRKNAAGGQVR